MIRCTTNCDGELLFGGWSLSASRLATRPVIHSLLVSNSEEEEVVALCFTQGLCLYADMFFFGHDDITGLLQNSCESASSLVVNTGKLIESHFIISSYCSITEMCV